MRPDGVPVHRRDALALLAAAATGSFAQPGPAATPPALQFGYASITWGGRDLEAMADIAAVGFSGVQLRANVVEAFAADAGGLRDLLASHGLTMVALSSGTVSVDADAAEQLARHTAHARFVRDVGGKYLQILDARPAGRAVVPGDFDRLGKLLTELGKRTADLGIPLGYHNHMHSLGEAPDEVARVLDAADLRYVKLLLDVAHYQQGGGDPVEAIRDYASHLLFLHLKDVESRPPVEGRRNARPYRFVELGQGRVDLRGVVRALGNVGYRGWVVVELDAVPEGAGSPREAAERNRRYLTDTLGLVL